MSAQSKQKANEERFIYSWYLPVQGGEDPAPAEQAGAVETEEQYVESPPVTKQSAHKLSLGAGFNLSSPHLKLLGLAAWSVIAGGGLIALLITHSPVPVNNVLAICGVWAALSALIWFVPGRLVK
jgi:hypothetical protein